MNSEFERFKKRMKFEHTIKSLLIGISFGAILTAILFIVLKRNGSMVPFYCYILIFLILSGLLFVGIYRMFTPSDKEIAKRLDHTFHLKEKVQTMILFQDKENVILSAQKENINQELERIPTSSLKLKISAFCYGLFVLALLLVPTSILIPPKEKPFTPIDQTSESSPSCSEEDSINSESTPEDSTPSDGDNSIEDGGEDSGEKQTSEENGEENKEDGEEENHEEPNDDPSEDKKEESSGGETLYGSDDQIFTDNGYSEYGEVIDEYHNKIVDETKDGNSPDDITDILDEYFASLYN